MKSFSVIVQLTLSCNMRCKHCYEIDQNYPRNTMKIKTLENIICKLQNEFDSVHYLWFGGEPLLAGLSVFQRIVDFQKEYSKETSKISNAIQTNGLLLDDKYFSFFKKHQFNISVSFDGLANDILRENTDLVKKRIALFNNEEYNLGVLSTIHKMNYRDQINIYESFKQQKSRFKFNRIFSANDSSKEWLIEDDSYLDYMKIFFDYWMHDLSGVSFSPFTDYLMLLLNYPSRSCENAGCLYKWLSINPSGDIYPCTRIHDKKYSMGNINTVSYISEIYDSKTYEDMVKKAIIRRKLCIENCEVYYYCNGGCNAMAINEASLESNDTQYCRFNEKFIPYVKEYLSRLDNLGNINPIVLDLIKNRPHLKRDNVHESN